MEKLYKAMIWVEGSDRSGQRVTVGAESLDEAREKLEQRHGKSNVFDLRNEGDAQTARPSARIGFVPDFVRHLLDWHDAQLAGLSQLGVELVLARSPESRSKTGAWVVGKREQRQAQLTVWSSGEVGFDAGSTDGGIEIQEHHDIAQADQLDALLARLVAYLR